jgi:DNA-binding transcriptional LysR family regulator
MDKSIPNLQDLIYFVITGRSSSITAASIESGIPVATLSRRISALKKGLISSYSPEHLEE